MEALNKSGCVFNLIGSKLSRQSFTTNWPSDIKFCFSSISVKWGISRKWKMLYILYYNAMEIWNKTGYIINLRVSKL